MKSKIIILILLISLLVLSGCSEIMEEIDYCKSQYEECKYSCGDGWFSGVCKTDCSDKYNNCKNG